MKFVIDLILALTTWRIASLLVNEPAPFELLSRFRHAVGVRYGSAGQPLGTNELAKLFTCVWCMSIWVGSVVALAHYRDWGFLVYGLAYSAVSIIIESVVNR